MPDVEDGPQSLAALIGYQEGAIVSKTLLSKPAGTVTIFAFDQGQGLSEHTTPYDALVLAVDGELEISIDAHPHRLAEGQILLLPANKPHAVQASRRGKMLLVMIRE